MVVGLGKSEVENAQHLFAVITTTPRTLFKNSFQASPMDKEKSNHE